jgi:5S rRNA maturation endonuclease (ribonuclease M5)
VTDFPENLLLETGRYVLVTGNRLVDGSVLSSLTFFTINKGQSTKVEIELRKEEVSLKSMGFLDPANIHLTVDVRDQEKTLADLMMRRSAVIVLLDPDSEPSKHILNDLGPFINQFNSWEGCFVFVNTREKESKNGAFRNYKLPAKTFYAVDAKKELERKLTLIAGMEVKNSLPMVVFCQPNGDLLLISSGYRIGMGESLLQLINKIGEVKVPSTKTSCTIP